MLEHVNVTVRDPMVAAKRFTELFGWKIRWQGEAIDNGYSVHVGTDDHYIAFYAPAGHAVDSGDTYTTEGGLNHIGVVVDDLDTVAAKVTALRRLPSDVGPQRKWTAPSAYETKSTAQRAFSFVGPSPSSSSIHGTKEPANTSIASTGAASEAVQRG